MNKMQASMRDLAAKSWSQNRVMRRISSVFRGCKNCGEWEMRPSKKTGRNYKHWFLQGEVYEAYEPVAMGWRFWCRMCGAMDAKCVEESEETVTVDPVKRARVLELERQLSELRKGVN